MISDTIDKARRDLAAYREEYPDAYAPYEYELNELEDHLGRVAILLDTPPHDLLREATYGSAYEAAWTAAFATASDVKGYRK